MCVYVCLNAGVHRSQKGRQVPWSWSNTGGCDSPHMDLRTKLRTSVRWVTQLASEAPQPPPKKKILPGKENVAWNVLLIKIFCLSSKFKHQDLLYGTRFLGCWSISSAYQYKAQLSYKVLAEQHKMRVCLICVLSAFLWFCHEPISDTHIWGRLEVTRTPPEHLYLSYVTRTKSPLIT